jgi:hypothetical protein
MIVVVGAVFGYFLNNIRVFEHDDLVGHVFVKHGEDFFVVTS